MPTFVYPCVVKKVGALGQTASGFRFRELVVSDGDPKYPQTIPITFTRGRTGILETIREGDELVIDIELRGREYNGKHYLSAEGWHVKRKAADGSMLDVVAPTPQQRAQGDLFANTPLEASHTAQVAPSTPLVTTSPVLPVQSTTSAENPGAVAPSSTPQPFDKSRHYRAGELVTHEGATYRTVLDDQGRLSWDAVKASTPSPAPVSEEPIPF